MQNSVTSDIATLAINTLRFLAIDAVEKAKSGHPGLPLGAAAMAYTLWTRHLSHQPKNPHWANRDRFVLSAGHGSMLLYALLHVTGYDVTLDDLKNFRQWGSKTPGHPEFGVTPGVETTTGPLGQGFANGVGMAMAEAFLAATFNRSSFNIMDHYTYVLAGDGDLMEGVTAEAASLAGTLKLGKLIVLYDDNKVSLSAPTSVSFTEDVKARFAAYGWHILEVADGNDVAAVDQAIVAAKAESQRPTLIDVHTTIGYGSPHKQGTFKAHGEPLGSDEVKLTKEALNWPLEPSFLVPAEALTHFRQAIEQGAQREAAWQKVFADWSAHYPDLARQWQAAQTGEIAVTTLQAIAAALPTYSAEAAPMATREVNSPVINTLAQHLPTFIGGDADLVTSTKTKIDSSGIFGITSDQPYAERNIAYGVREHAMAAITNGLAIHGGIVKPFTATFLTFSDYMRPAIRLAALMQLSPIYVFTHDSVGLGEDGPTHQPIEQIAALRAMPGLVVLRPADANEMVAAWEVALSLKGPVAILGSRQKLPVLSPVDTKTGVARGAYIKADCSGTPQVLLVSTGSELELALQAHATLTQQGIAARVISMPSWELFRQQDSVYREAVLPSAVKNRVAIEAGATFGWREWVGETGRVIGLDHFGASAPYETLYEKYGFTVEAIVKIAQELVVI